jgi:cell division protein FtsI (penicillin-binding protein 3)
VADEQAWYGFRLPWKARSKSRTHRGEAATRDWRNAVRSRVTIAAVLFALWTVAIEARLIYLQIVRHDELTAMAERQRTNTFETTPLRGDILDRNGRVLAYSVDAESIFADPSEVENPDKAAALVCGALSRCDAADRHAIARHLRKEGQFAYLARRVSPDEEARIRRLDLKGIGLIKETRRFYPKRELLSHVLGYVGTENVGLGGLESSFDAKIRGISGQLMIMRDAQRQAMTSKVKREATAGASLELTIDQFLQNIAERELQAAVTEHRAVGGSVVIMDPNSGEILALANAPTFNPNTYSKAPEAHRRNRAIQDLYEPGSTFKIVTASAALEEGLMTPEDLVDVSAGMIRFGSRTIPDMHRYGILSFTDVIVKSSNVGAIKIGMKLGPERLGRYVSRFGFGQQVAPDFRGENPGIVWDPAKLDPSALASVSMGYQIGVTPLQMASAMSSIANGGTLYEPHIVRALIKDEQRFEIAPKVVRRTISERTAAQLTAIMEAVVDRGTAKSTRMDGYTIAGKTGTAHKVIDGRYSPTEINVSFVGFVPSRKPALTIIVLIDSPHGKGDTGGAVAAPVFKRIAEASLRHLGIAPTVNAPPPVLVARRGEGSGVERTGVRLPIGPIDGVRHANSNVMPDLRGMGMREAVRRLTSLGLSSPEIAGTGFVLAQSPEAGSLIVPGGASALKLGREPLAVPPGAPQ